jgi:putative hydrolase of the HAD superfamily
VNSDRDRRVLLFDLGGVVVSTVGTATLQQWLPTLARAESAARWHACEAVGQFERGRIAADEFATRFVADWQLTMAPAQFLREFTRFVRGFFPGAQALLQRLRERHTVACLSNTNAAHWAELVEVRSAFDVCIASHLIGHMKPDREAFEHALLALNAAPQHVCFFDDLLPNVRAAQQIGIQAFHVQGLDGVEAALRELGIAHDTRT